MGARKPLLTIRTPDKAIVNFISGVVTITANRNPPVRTGVTSVFIDCEDQMTDELFELIGGKRTVWAATEAFYRRVLADATLSSFSATGEKSSYSSVAPLPSCQSLFSGGRFLSARPLAPPASQIRPSRPRLVHPSVSKT